MRILIIEDEDSLARNISDILVKEGYLPEIASDGEEGLQKGLSEDFNLIVLDILLPKLNGYEVLRELRRNKIKTPVLILTVKNSVDDRVQGLDSGADDYLIKPFAIAELLARIRTLLRRTSEDKSAALEARNLILDTTKREAFIKDKPLNLTPKEYSILELLLYNKNRVLSRLSIAEYVWGDNFDLFNMTNFVDVHIKNIRKKIDELSDEKIIKTVRGIGFMIEEQA
jgi:DNA-binding response OmpR family regulator